MINSWEVVKQTYFIFLFHYNSIIIDIINLPINPLKDIAVILINYNTSEYTIQCVKSIISHTKKNLKYAIIIIDNNSLEADYLRLNELIKIDQVSIFKRPVNEGYATANMAGVKMVDAEYYFFLNNDTILKNDVLSILYRFMEKNYRVGISSGQMYGADGSLGINFNYFPDLKLKFLGSGFLRIFSSEKYPKKGIRYGHPVQVPLLNGSSLFVRGKTFKDIGGFDSSFFLYCEEEDLALRMKNKGYSCFLVPEAEYIHFEGKSSLKDNGINYIMLREFYISQYYLYQKHYGKIASIIWRITQFIRSFRKFYIHPDYVKLAFFILRKPRMKYSLRHLQSLL